MKTAEVYVARANEAAQMAQAEEDSAAKAALLKIAETWLLMAEAALDEKRAVDSRSARQELDAKL